MSIFLLFVFCLRKISLRIHDQPSAAYVDWLYCKVAIANISIRVLLCSSLRFLAKAPGVALTLRHRKSPEELEGSSLSTVATAPAAV